MKEVTPGSKMGYRLWHDGILAFARAERQGMRIDVEYCHGKQEFLTRKIARMQKKFEQTEMYDLWYKLYGLKTNTASDWQLSKVLYGEMGVKIGKETASGKGSTDFETLSELDIPALSYLIDVRKLKKLRDTYLASFVREQVDGFIHPFFNLHTVLTFRSSSDRPNFQNIPKRDTEAMKICRNAIYPRKGHQLLEVDFGALEVSIAACYHKDPAMVKYLTSESDMHGDMAEQIFKLDKYDKKQPEHKYLRGATKNGFVFPQFYGDYFLNNAIGLARWVELRQATWKPGQGIPMPGGITISDHLISKGIKSFKQFVDHLEDIQNDFWGNRFGVYGKWKKTWMRKYQKRGYFDLLTGFRCSGVMRKNEVINYPVQGAAFHCLLWSFIELDRISIEEKWDTKLIGQIHDAVLLDVHPDELNHVAKVLKRVTCVDLPKAWSWITVPLSVSADICGVDEPWSNIDEYKLEDI
jgi:DNA polymerase I